MKPVLASTWQCSFQSDVAPSVWSLTGEGFPQLPERDGEGALRCRGFAIDKVREEDCSWRLSKFSDISSIEHLTVVPFNLFEVLFF